MKQSVRAALGAGLLSVVTLHRSVAQNPPLPPPSQAGAALQQAVQQNPGLTDIIRQRILQSGLSAEQVRARLAASGYPANLLDAYLSGTVSGAALPAGALELAAIQALAVPPIEQRLLSVDTGMIRMRGPNVSSRVFGVDVFRVPPAQLARHGAHRAVRRRRAHGAGEHAAGGAAAPRQAGGHTRSLRLSLAG